MRWHSSVSIKVGEIAREHKRKRRAIGRENFSSSEEISRGLGRVLRHYLMGYIHLTCPGFKKDQRAFSM